ncbi:hypothetical protein [Paenibacillus eucommiae]|uniref:Uncharacterized protein n=1 Tax=Paenibacillus eucommiae TaxID=1355755 RepID=A0ABS4IX17_9BACL|nr:hypothetical protein [Paenibacillus eucommiae]MBP1992100.1 hypothetical protein [Paenibacillus eucommiae]
MAKVYLDPIKRGDTVYYTATWEGVAASELRSQIRDSSGRLIADVVIEETGEPGTFRFSVDDTTAWPTGTLETDIKYTSPDGTIKTSDTTMCIPAIRGITI